MTSACGRRRRSLSCSQVAEQQQVDVDFAGAVTRSAGGAADGALDGLAGVQQRLGVEVRLDPQACVQERRLVEHEPHRIGVVGRGRGDRSHPVLGQQIDRRLQVGAPLADVRAQTQVARQSSSRERHTSTDTDSTGSAIGGSGLVALTHTSPASKSSSSRSAIAVQSASSVAYERR